MVRLAGWLPVPASESTSLSIDLRSNERTRWPYTGRPFGQVVGWVNIELMKNVAEMSLARRYAPTYAGGRFTLGGLVRCWRRLCR